MNEDTRETPRDTKKKLKVSGHETPAKEEEMFQIDTFQEKIIKKYAEQANLSDDQLLSENELGSRTVQSSQDNNNGNNNTGQGVEDFYKKKIIRQNKSLVGQKTFNEDNLAKRIRIMEDKKEKHIHLLKSDFLMNGQVDRELNNMMLINNPNLNDNADGKKSKKENFVSNE